MTHKQNIKQLRFMKIVAILVILIVTFLTGLNLNLRRLGFGALCNFAGGKYLVRFEQDYNVASCVMKK